MFSIVMFWSVCIGSYSFLFLKQFCDILTKNEKVGRSLPLAIKWSKYLLFQFVSLGENKKKWSLAVFEN